MTWREAMDPYDALQERLQEEFAADQSSLLTDDTLDELAKDLGYRLDVILIQHEIAEGVTQHVVDERIKKLSRAYDVTKDEVRRRIGGLS